MLSFTNNSSCFVTNYIAIYLIKVLLFYNAIVNLFARQELQKNLKLFCNSSRFN